MSDRMTEWAQLSGVGIGMRAKYAQDVMAAECSLPWLELLTDNYIHHGGPALDQAAELAERYPVTLHGVALSIGGYDPLDPGYVRAIRRLADTLGTRCVSDHLCFSSHQSRPLHDLLPVERDESTLQHIAQRVKQVQDELGFAIALENISAYVDAPGNTMSVAEFFSRLVEMTECRVLLDVNNAMVNHWNLDHDAHAFVDAMAELNVVQMHLAGHAWEQGIAIDTHGAEVCDDVWSLFRYVVAKLPNVPVCIERDQNLPEFKDLVAECNFAKNILEAAHESVDLAS